MRNIIKPSDESMKSAVVHAYLCNMPNRSLAWLLVVLLLMSVSAKTLLWLDYEARTEFYATTLCVQKEVADNCCKGSCYLTKELQQQDQREEESFPTLKLNTELIFISNEKVNLDSKENVQEVFYHHTNESELTGSCSEILRPPIAS